MIQNFQELLGLLYENKLPSKSVKCDVIELISKQLNFPRKIVKKGVNDGYLTINNVVIKTPEVKLVNNSIVKFQGIIINIPSIEASNRFDEFISLILNKCYGYTDIRTLYDDQKNILAGFTIEYFSIYGYNVDELKESSYADHVLELLDEVFRRNIDSDDSHKKLKRKEVVEMLISRRESEYLRFEESTSRIVNGFFELKSDAVFNEIGKIVNSKSYKILIKPLLQGVIDPIIIIKKIKKGYERILEGDSRESRITINIEVQKTYKGIEAEINQVPQNRISAALLGVLKYYRRCCDDYVGFKDTGEPILSIIAENRTYNFHDKKFSIYVIVKNSGSGIARNIKIENSITNEYKIPNQTIIDILAPDESRTTRFTFENISLSISGSKEYEISYKLSWANDFNKEFNRLENKINIIEQKGDLPWEELFYSKPYNKRAIDDPAKLFGREQLLYDLQRNIEKSVTITSTIIYGQKRVGKSSIVKTLNKIYQRHPEIIFIYKSIGDLKNVESIKTLQRVGDTIFKSMVNEFRKKNPDLISHLKDLEEPSFLGSLSPLNDLINELTLLNPKTRIIICLDEFDELNQDFFENNELGRTFALNLGKGLNDNDNVGFILVGSENMTHKAKNGMRLNTYEQKRVDTFNKITEYDSYCKLISEPVKSCLTFSSDVFKIIFDLSNGNPYFTNLLMTKVFADAYEKKISYIDKDFIVEPIENFINIFLTNNDFAHFLEDGLSEDPVKYEIALDRRRRLLTAIILAKKEKSNTKWSDIKRKIKYPKKFTLTETQFEDTLKEFTQRGIIKEDENNSYIIIPPIYEKWLVGTGVYQIIADLEDKDEILEKLYEESKLLLKDEDYFVLVTLLDEVPTKQKVSDVKSFVEQFINIEDKRRLVEFLKGTVAITSQEAISHIRKIFTKIWSTIILGVGEKPIIKDGEITCFPDSFGQNQGFCEIIKDTFLFAKTKTIKTFKDLPNLDINIKNCN